MSTPLVIVLAALIWVAIFYLKNQQAGQPVKYKARALLTENEKEFYGRLRQALPEHVIFSQVAMGALLDVDMPRDHREFWRARGRFSQKIVDFAVLDPATLAVVALVELDDRTHNKNKDADRDRMTALAGYRTVRFESKRKPDAAAIRAAVFPLNAAWGNSSGVAPKESSTISN